MLLNEVQQQHAEMTAKIDAQAAQIAMQASQLSEQGARQLRRSGAREIEIARRADRD